MRAAFDHALALAFLIVSPSLFKRGGGLAARIPILGPFPDIANHVVSADSVWRKTSDRGRAGEAVFRVVTERKKASRRLAQSSG